MYDAMRAAPLGDDVLGDEPTVTKLEQLAADMLAKEAALFVPSGTMGNQIAIASHTRPGDAILVEEEAHILYYEVGGPAMHAQVVSWTLPSKLGTIDPEVVESRILKRDLHRPGTTLLCVENTHNRAGGTIVPLTAMAAYKEVADRHELKIHLDGARVFNASVALGIPVWEIAKYADSVNFCLSKGLRSPVGSLLCGAKDFIEEARIWRKRLGGGMRQAGILAACGIVSLTEYVERLADDHRRARGMAQKLSELPGITIDWDRVQTNMVLVNTKAPAEWWVGQLQTHGILCFPVAANRVRLVFHADVDDAGVDRAAQAFAKVASSSPAHA
jgi:threonine aldolase